MDSIISKLNSRLHQISFRQITYSILLLKIIVIGYFVVQLMMEWNGTIASIFNFKIFNFIFIGFLAQIIDGALGMAYGISCTGLLLNFGIPPAFASASVHTAEIFTTGISGLSHIKFKNIDKPLFFKLVIPGTIGAIIGAYIISEILDGNLIKPYIAIYLLVLGVYILLKAFQPANTLKKKLKYIPFLASIGGFMDAIGGGGWGPIVTSNLIIQGQEPRQAIGTVNTAEFYVTYFATAIFIFILGIQYYQIIIGLIIGGAIAAPFGAYIASKVPRKFLFFAIGVLIILTSSYTIINSL